MQTALHKASYSGDLDQVKQLLLTGSPNVFDQDGFTPLHEAAHAGHLDVLNTLIDAGAQIDARDRFGNSALHEAARFDRAEACQALIERGANIEARGYMQRTPLHYSAAYGSEVATATLLQHGADVAAGANVDLQDTLGRVVFGQTPLHMAACCGKGFDGKDDAEAYARVAGKLIDAGADVNASEGVSVRSWAAVMPGANTSWNAKPIHYAQSPEMVHELASRGADLDAHRNFYVEQLHRGDAPQDLGTPHPLTNALNNGNTEVALALLSCGADPTIANALGESFDSITTARPLEWADMQASVLQRDTQNACGAWSPADLSGDHLVPQLQEQQPQAHRQGRRL